MTADNMSNPKNYRADAIRILSEFTGESEAAVAKVNKLTDIGIDEHDDVDILMAFEDEYDIIISEDEERFFKTINDIVAFLEKSKHEKQP